MKIAIIGAGMAGLGAARTLQQNGHDVSLFDKGASVGGRVGTRRFEYNGATTFFDHGAQNVKSQNTALESELGRIGFNQRVFIDVPVCLHDEDRVLAPDKNANAEPKWTTQNGMKNLPHALSEGLNVHLNVRVSRLEENADGLTLRDENNRVLDVCERAIITLPAPQAAGLLANSSLRDDVSARIATLRSVEYSRCLSVLLGFDFATELDWYALLAQDRQSPLLWLACENAKSGFVPPDQTAFVAQLGDAISCELYESDDAEIVRQTLLWLQRIDGRLVAPSRSLVKRWKFSQPKNPIGFADANAPADRVLVCGDGLSKGRVTAAWDSGVEAAQWLIRGHDRRLKHD